ncbi:hypothetical protein ABPG72_001926 [Tetrahymena utriculariae]
MSSERKFTHKQIDPTPYQILEIESYIKLAQEVKKKAYCPYSKFHVGCVLFDQDGNMHEGVNVENASYGLTICAERNAIISAVTKGMKSIRLIVINCKTEKVGSPCGACRQVIGEFSNEKTIVVLSNDNGLYEITDFESILPGAFGPKDLFGSPNC